MPAVGAVFVDCVTLKKGPPAIGGEAQKKYWGKMLLIFLR